MIKKAAAVKGIGELAVWTKAHGIGSLNVYWRRYKFIILTGTDKKDLEAAKALAKKVVGKLNRLVMSSKAITQYPEQDRRGDMQRSHMWVVRLKMTDQFHQQPM